MEKIRLASQQPEDLFPVVIIKDDEEKKHKKPKLANLLAVKVQDKEGVGQKRKLSQMTGGEKDKGKEKKDTNQKKVVVLTPFMATKKTKTNQEKGSGDKGTESNGSKQVKKKKEQETATSKENEEDGEGGGGLFSLVDY